MLTWIDQYYVGMGIEDAEDLRRKIDRKEYPKEIYLLTLASNSKNLLDLFQADSLKTERLYEWCPLIVGIAGGKAEAMELAGKILQDCQNATGTFRVEEYLKNR